MERGATGHGEMSHNPLVVNGIVGDVLDPFTPTMELRVYIGGKILRSGVTLRPSQLAKPPRVDVGGNDFRTFYTLVMVDADYPNPSNPYLKEYLHWLVTDIPGTTGAAFGKEVVSYEKPEMEKGIHRLVLMLFQQRGRDTVTFFGGRKKFDTRDFASAYGLNQPLAAVYFNGHGEKGCGGRRA